MPPPTDLEWITTAIGWTILHSIWQIFIVGITWFVVLSIFKKAKTTTKYAWSICSMFMILLMTVITLFSEMKSTYPAPELSLNKQVQFETEVASLTANQEVINPASSEMLVEDIPVDQLPEEGISWEWLDPSVLKILVGIWLCGVLVLAIRFMIQWLGIRRLAKHDIYPFNADQLAVFDQLKKQIGIKRSVTFLQSALVAAPMTFGHLKPYILLPLGMINGFPPAQIEAIILHELAHIRRNDFLINMIQTWLEILFFYHPFIWLISKRIRIIREELCDDEAVFINQDKVAYAESLLNLQNFFLNNKNQLAMNSKGNKSELSKRIHRLFQVESSNSQKRGSLNIYLFSLLIFIAMGTFAFSNFSYPTVSIAVDKMNVLYIGVDNPLTVAVAGVTSEKTKVESEDLELGNQGDGHYIARATKPGTAIIKVTAKGHATKEIEFRVKRIPDPIAKINKSHGGNISAEVFKKTEGVDAMLDRFDFDASCVVERYNMTVVPKQEDPVESINIGAKYNEKSKALLEKIKAGDIIYFDNVKCQCPGDAEVRAINSMVFKIK